MPSRSKIDARTPVRTISSVMKGEPSTSFTSVRAEPVAPVPTTLSLPVQPQVRAPIQPITSRSTRKIPALTSTTSTSSSGSGINTDSLTSTLKKGLVGALGVAAANAFMKKLLEKQDPAPIDRRDTTQKPAPIDRKDTPADSLPPPNLSGAYDENGKLRPGWELDENNNPVWVGSNPSLTPGGAYDEEGNLMPGWQIDEDYNPVWVGSDVNQRQDETSEPESFDPTGDLAFDFNELNDSDYYNNYYSYKQGGNVSYDDAYSFADGGEATAENFDASAYLAGNPDVEEAIRTYYPGQDPAALAWQHYNLHGKAEGRGYLYRPAPAATAAPAASVPAASAAGGLGNVYLSSNYTEPFNAAEYLENNPDVYRYVSTHLDDFGGSLEQGALQHAIKYGVDEQRLTSTGDVYDRNLDTNAYLRNNPDVATYYSTNPEEFGNDPARAALEHYIKFGRDEGRAAPVLAGGSGGGGGGGSGGAGGGAGGVGGGTNQIGGGPAARPGGGAAGPAGRGPTGQPGRSPAEVEPTMDFGYIPSRTTDFGPGMTGGRTGTGSVFVPYQEYSQGMEYNPYQQLYSNLGISGYADVNEPVTPSQRPYPVYPQYQDEGYGDGSGPYPANEMPVQQPITPYDSNQSIREVVNGRELNYVPRSLIPEYGQFADFTQPSPDMLYRPPQRMVTYSHPSQAMAGQVAPMMGGYGNNLTQLPSLVNDNEQASRGLVKAGQAPTQQLPRHDDNNELFLSLVNYSGSANPLVGNITQASQGMADGGSTHYTYGKVIDPADNLEMSMKRGGLSHTVPSHHENPVVNDRIDFKKGAAVNGAGDGQSDDIPAWLADGEYVMDSELVSMLGNGSNKAGAKILDEFREQVRAHKRNAPLGKIPPKAKSPLNYLKEALNG